MRQLKTLRRPPIYPNRPQVISPAAPSSPLRCPPPSIGGFGVSLRTATAPRGFGLSRHGEGTRSVAHLAIFRAFIDLLAREENDNLESAPVLGIEEPEVHLHPHAIRALGTMLTIPPRQMFFTTHSPELARSVDLTSIQVLRRAATGTERRAVPVLVAGKPLLDDRDQLKLEVALRAGATEILFSRATVLCEGPSEVQAYPFIASALDIDMDQLSLSLVPVDGSYFFHFLRILADDALRIPWVISADGDGLRQLAGQLVKLGTVTDVEIQGAETLGTLESAILRPHDVYTLPSGHNLEEALIRGGAAAEYESAIATLIGPSALRTSSASLGVAGDPLEDRLVAFMKGNTGRKWKVLFAGIVAEQITQDGSDPSRIPSTIVDALQLAKNYAVGSATKAF